MLRAVFCSGHTYTLTSCVLRGPAAESFLFPGLSWASTIAFGTRITELKVVFH